MKKLILLGAALCLALAVSPVSAADKVSPPKGYEKWEKSKEKVVNDKKSLFYGIHYTYVDKKAWTAFKAGGNYPEGSRFVVVFYNIKDEGGKPGRGKKNMIVLMEKNKKFAETGGWIFAGFNSDGKPSGVDPIKNCFECHLKEAKATDFVISKYADFK
jgi:opacity protein-like surface antigen